MDDAKISQISQRMGELRSDLGDDVEEIAESARTLTDYRHYVRQFPWTCMAGAAAVGYFLVPKREEMIPVGADALESRDNGNQPVVMVDPNPHRMSGASGVLFGLLASSIRLATMQYVSHAIGKMVNDSVSDSGQANGEGQ